MVDQEITFDKIKSLLDEKYYLRYIHRDTDLSHNFDKVGESIRGQDWGPIDAIVDEWFLDDFYGMDSAIDDLKEKFQTEFGMDEESAEELIEEHKEKIEEVIYERDASTPLDDVLKNTGKMVVFYETDLYLPERCSEEGVQESLKEIKKFLKIKLSDTKYDKEIREMVVNASYGGNLVVYFNIDGSDVSSLINLEDMNTVVFSNPTLAIIDTSNGSGGDTTLKDFSFSVRLNTDKFFLDKEIKYNYTYEVCGMDSSWCNSTVISFEKKRYKRVVESRKSSVGVKIEQDKAYDETYRSGKCSAGDMDIKRHRRVVYENTPPYCGSRCKDCGTFWVD